MLKKIPYGIKDYKRIIEENYYYIDKTMYLEKLENVGSIITYLRPRRFGKTLFTSLLYYYYDINSKDIFDKLFKDTYVYKHPTINRNSYYILKFDFSGIVSGGKEEEELASEFNAKVVSGIEKFNNKYKINFEIDKNLPANKLMVDFFDYFVSLNKENKIYMIIDEYDNFTNAILEGNATRFINLVGNEGLVRGFYSVIKEHTDTIVERFFMTGICPITLNSMTTGFNISTNISTGKAFNSMIGLTHNEVKNLLKAIDPTKAEEIYNIMITNYDGYLFNEELNDNDRVFNATLVMYFLNNYKRLNNYPKEIVDYNVLANLQKLENIIKINNNPYYKEILDTILKQKEISSNLVKEYNLEERYDYNDIVSMLYYFGYLSINKENIDGKIVFVIPNKVNSDLYNNYFIKILSENNIDIEDVKYTDSFDGISYTGKIDKLNKYVEAILKEYSNRIFIKFDEKYIQLIYYNILRNTKRFNTYMEREFNKGYADIYIESNNDINKYNILIELKYLPKKSLKERKEKISEGKIEIEKYIKIRI